LVFHVNNDYVDNTPNASKCENDGGLTTSWDDHKTATATILQLFIPRQEVTQFEKVQQPTGGHSIVIDFSELTYILVGMLAARKNPTRRATKLREF